MNRQVHGMEPDAAVYKTLLESTRAIPWRIDWETMRFSYIGPQIEDLLGWTPDSWQSIDDWVERMHPEDRDRVVNYCVSQSRCGIDHEADYRALTRDGDYVWIRDVVHVVRRDGEVEALVGFMFDISERKAREDELLRLKLELEALSYQDGLTGVANRRHFDNVLEREWASAMRSGTPLAIVMLDLDHFKDFNDLMGHPAGDDCLRRVASELGKVSRRPRDLLARIGGEEFILVLPETDAEAARVIADRCRQLVRSAEIPHSGSPEGFLTVSVGVCSMVPAEGQTQTVLLEAVDRQLYSAKRQGRNRVVVAENRPAA
ncbi:sensor domain-containing diguanylate cyclase [Methylonatrum kenyense]|uniref:sensor domain-containing diguanylate cyclase n=1 Tax=Methylonatrum kenyense TaxID=455253 RepID=UPI0020C03402|nr:sensor domain-containing diguanylate cyclase [Methylonatrum kenyense]MCK8515025.1 sensor domain-containing diguanylate cyclase [Methylonatrum kenyense]